jgi:hypothetical protein
MGKEANCEVVCKDDVILKLVRRERKNKILFLLMRREKWKIVSYAYYSSSAKYLRQLILSNLVVIFGNK